MVLKGHTAHLNLTLTLLCVWCLLPFPKCGTIGGSGGVGNRQVSLYVGLRLSPRNHGKVYTEEEN